MEKILMLVSVLGTLTFGGHAQQAVKNTVVHFETGKTWAQIQAKAKQENKYVFVDVFATWCGPCKMMDRDVYTNSGVTKAMARDFIAVKIQQDSSKQDDNETKSHYADAKEFVQKYHVTAFPSFYFFTPGGELVHEDLGYRNVPEFLRLLKLALDPQKTKMLPAMEAYRKGKREYVLMANLAVYVKNLIGNNALADSIATDYKTGYLDKLTKEQLLTKENLDWVDKFTKLINSKDQIFAMCYSQPDSIDRVKGDRGWAKWIVSYVVTREELMDKLVRDNKSNGRKPDWEKIKASIFRKYPKLNAQDIVLNFKIIYYRTYNLNWVLWANSLNEQLKHDPPQKEALNAFIRLNMNAWDAFQHCNSIKVLQMALSWSDESVLIYKGTNDVIQCLDTRANLLYKLKRPADAISQEKEAITLSTEIAKKQGKIDSDGPYLAEFKAVLNKMEHNLPTW